MVLVGFIYIYFFLSLYIVNVVSKHVYIILIEKKKEKKSRFPVNEDSQNNSEDFHVTGSSRETLYSDDNQIKIIRLKKLTEIDLLIGNSAKKNSQ